MTGERTLQWMIAELSMDTTIRAAFGSPPVLPFPETGFPNTRGLYVGVAVDAVPVGRFADEVIMAVYLIGPPGRTAAATVMEAVRKRLDPAAPGQAITRLVSPASKGLMLKACQYQSMPVSPQGQADTPVTEAMCQFRVRGKALSLLA